MITSVLESMVVSGTSACQVVIVCYLSFSVFANVISVATTCTIPMSAHEDDRITPIISQFLEQVNGKLPKSPGILESLELDPVRGPEITADHPKPVILPCIAASRVGSDISAALTKAKIGMCYTV